MSIWIELKFIPPSLFSLSCSSTTHLVVKQLHFQRHVVSYWVLLSDPWPICRSPTSARRGVVSWVEQRSKIPRGTTSPTSLPRKESRRNSDRLPATTAIVARLFYHPAFYQESGEVVGAASCQVPGHALMEGEISDDQIIGQVFEDQDYLEKITKLQGYLDEVKRIVRESCSQEVLEVALSSISSLITTLSSMSSSTKLHSSL